MVGRMTFQTELSVTDPDNRVEMIVGLLPVCSSLTSHDIPEAMGTSDLFLL